ncbi:hypothetical protein STH12_01843 [Shewanella khirikhana]|uniref:Cobalt transport protein CbiM n=2 Tax=Shewanella khirikhana TaxID=1965282 RepID=A0A3S9L5W8_9GAMM|nr:hypothetical protein STH12_01843 [Shewanella khirikhana]
MIDNQMYQEYPYPIGNQFIFMLEFWQGLLANIQWQLSGADALGLLLLTLWLWLIYPSRDLAELAANRQLQGRALLALSAMMGIWLFNASIHGLLQLHFLGLVTLMLMFSWRLATILALLPSAFYCVFVLKAPGHFGAYALMGVCLPLFVAFVIHNRSFYLLPKNLFVLIFVSGFANAGLSQLSHESFWSLWLGISGAYSWQVLWHDYLSLSILMMFPEALLNGMAVTLLVVYRPEWLADYSDRHYLWRG